MNICFFQANLDTGHSNSVSMSDRSYDNNSFLISINQLALFDDLMSLCRLAKRFSTVFSGSRQILLKKFKAFICICASMGNNPERIYGTGSAVCVGSDNTCFKSLFRNELSLSIYFLFGKKISSPYVYTGSTYIFIRCTQIAGSKPLFPCRPADIRL